jgi:hypothetical protein
MESNEPHVVMQDDPVSSRPQQPEDDEEAHQAAVNHLLARAAEYWDSRGFQAQLKSFIK